MVRGTRVRVYRHHWSDIRCPPFQTSRVYRSTDTARSHAPIHQSRPTLHARHHLEAQRQRLYRFTTNDITVIQPWPAALCWVKTNTWRGASCNIRLDVLDQDTAAPYPYRFELEAWRTVPEPVRQRVVKASLMGLQWNTLRLLARCPAAHQLVDELPLLAAAAANLRPILGLGRHPRT